EDSFVDSEAREIEEGFRATCSGALASLCHKRHYDMLMDKGHSKRSASSINGHLLNRLSGQSWTRVHAILNRDIGLMSANWAAPLLHNDAYILRESSQEDLPSAEEGTRFARNLLLDHHASKGDDSGRVAEALIRCTKYMHINEAFKFLLRSMPAESRTVFVIWLAQQRASKKRKRPGNQEQ
ncbi:unnamed protein product, partial [Symbiodinium pilosum]